nr:reverse transcriptase domain-containing protein [Tanacetum cinerariifolium]
MEDEFYNLTVKGNDLKTYVRRFQELAILCPNMLPNTVKLMKVFIGGLPQSIEGTVTASKTQTLEEATNIAQRLMDQMIKYGPYTVECHTCNKVGHLTRNCKNNRPATGSNLQPMSVTCHAYREKGHYNYQCSKENNSAHERTYFLKDKNAHKDPNVVTDYTMASPGYISPDPPDNLSKYLFASLAILPFHNVQAYNDVANKPPIPP